MTALYPIKDHQDAFLTVEVSGGLVFEATMEETSLIQG